MPSVEQCETASGNVTALPSTLEFFDKFKVLSSVSENGKDSDSEESFHLPLDDDDMENQSVVSNGRDREIQNEETEDDILNKFETVPTGTPDHIDSHIEDTILDDDIPEDQKFTKVNPETSDNSKAIETIPHIEEISESEANRTKIEIKLTYGYDDYEDSGDGEFKSIYETEDLAAESKIEDSQDKRTEPAEMIKPPKITESVAATDHIIVPTELTETTEPIETVEAMEIAEEPEIIDCASEESNELPPLRKDLEKVASALDNFEDSMEVEQEDTNQDIANIIEKLEDPDTPMEDIDTVGLNDEGDVNMVENSDEKALASDNAENSEKITEEEAEVIKDEDVEMTGDCQINEEPKDSCKENVDQLRINESSEVVATFQEPLEVPTDCTEAYSGETQEQSDINDKEKSPVANTESSENDEEIVDHGETEKGVKILDNDRTSEDLDRTNDSIESKNVVEDEGPVDNEKFSKKDGEDEPEEIPTDPESTKNMATDECGSDESTNMDKLEIVDELETPDGNVSTKLVADLKDDDLLKELDKTINESETDEELKHPAEKENVENTETSNEKELEKDGKQLENLRSQEKDVFKAPVDVSKAPIEISTQKESAELNSEISNDKTEEDESDLLDISMVRETEEDDACAIADALNDKDAQISEKSDEEQSEKVETEQEGSDVDKDNDNDAMDPIDFDDTDDDSHVEGAEHDDSSNAESTKDRDKIVNVSESSKDSMGESEPKRRKASIADGFIESSNDCTAMELSASESGEEPEKMEVPDSLVPHTSLNLESTQVQDEAVSSVSEKEKSVPAALSEAVTETENKDEESNKTDISTEKTKESTMVEKESTEESLPEISKSTENTSSERKKSPLNKRTLSTSDIEDAEISAKKPKLATADVGETQKQKETVEKSLISSKKPVEKDTAIDNTIVNDKVKTLTGFSKFMQCRQFTAKLSRSDLEQFCIQKICESLMLKSSEGELHQSIKKHEKTIDVLRKDMQQLSKQCKDLEIVNKKLMNELRNQNTLKKPLVPLKITRSVGLQVRLNPGNETPNQTRRRQGNTPLKQMVGGANTTVNRLKVTTGSIQQPTAVRQVLQNSPQKSPLTAGQTTVNNATPTNPLLAQALQPQKSRQTAVAAKRTAAPVRKTAEAPKPTGSGVIDLTEEDDRLAGVKPVVGSTIKIINKAVSTAGTPNKTLMNKMISGKAMINQGKQVQKTMAVGQNKSNLSQGIRLTPSVITSSASGSPQMVYVVPTITSNAGGTQKVAFVNFQPTNGVLSGTLNGSTVSVMSNKGQTLTLKTVPNQLRNTKHPASLPPPPRVNLDPKLRPLLPKPHLTIKKIETGIILQWKMPYNLEQYESIASYQLYAYQETSSAPSTDMWRKVGDVKALALPMACTLTQFADKNKYYFAVRSVDVHKRIGAFSDPEEISL